MEMTEKRLTKGGSFPVDLSRNVLKLIAIVTITIGHFFLYTLMTLHGFGIGKPWLGILCYICFVGPPIFMFFISEGFQYTSSKLRYGRRLFIFALITQVAHAITTYQGLGFSFNTFFFEWNVFFALLLGFLDLCILNSEWKWAIKISAVIATLLLSYVTNTEWWIFGQLIIILFYYLRNHQLLKFICVTVCFYLTFVLGDCNLGGDFEVAFFTKTMYYILPAGMAGIALVCFCYHGRNGKKSNFLKYFFYVFYPLHLVLIDIVILFARKTGGIL